MRSESDEEAPRAEADGAQRPVRAKDASQAAALTSAELSAALEAIGGFEARPLVAVAVSGGPDSMALLLLADRWARTRGGQAWGLTVDHGLRPESADEARTVAGWLAARGIPHAVLVWVGEKPRTRIQETARAMRYQLLAEWCRCHGVLHLLTAHHREDQAETYLIRRRAGSGIEGLAAMPAVRELSGCRLVRPLLATPRARLAAFLAAEGQPSLQDPSNRNPAFERARIRAERDGVGGAPLDLVTSDVRDFGRRRIAHEEAVGRLIGRAVALHPAGFAMLDAHAIVTADADQAQALLARVIACIGGAAYPARRERVARLAAELRARPDRARTLGGCRFVPWRGRVLVLRELAAAVAQVRIEPGARVLWDRRFVAALPTTAKGALCVGYLGRSGKRLAERQLAFDVPAFVHPVLPALGDGEGLASVPHLGYRRRGVGVLPIVFFRPANPLSGAGFTVV